MARREWRWREVGSVSRASRVTSVKERMLTLLMVMSMCLKHAQMVLTDSVDVWPDVLEGRLLASVLLGNLDLLDEPEALEDVGDVVQPPDARLHHCLLLITVDDARSQLQVHLGVLLRQHEEEHEEPLAGLSERGLPLRRSRGCRRRSLAQWGGGAGRPGRRHGGRRRGEGAVGGGRGEAGRRGQAVAPGADDDAG